MSPLAPLPSEMTIYAVSEMRSAWLDWLTALPQEAQEDGGESCVKLDASAVDTVDAAGLQLLVSLRRSLQARGRTLAVSPVSDPFRDACTVLGLDARTLVAGAAVEVTS